MLVPPSSDKASLGRTNLVATKDIPAGEEIFIQYPVSGEDIWLFPAARRQEALLLAKHFRCKCEACTNPVNYDALFAQLAEHAQVLQVQGQKMPRDSLAYQSTKAYGGTARIHMAQEYIAILRRAGFCDEQLSEAYLMLALLHEEQKEWAQAVDATTGGLKVEEHFFDKGVEWEKLGFVREKCLKKLMGGYS
ncbi:hypothetical protein BDV96DRAFT_601693 [Lophiotrema nucula]|uniref:SET domain-containing protein n=1 Tax=Lophiotrema nucula TaxID=690887 RepID=A0A6A5Z3I6_9PLEO|nr:hypothetical protein BDV96DRAFT_601693 [Lophiotrema nucula]